MIARPLDQSLTEQWLHSSQRFSSRSFACRHISWISIFLIQSRCWSLRVSAATVPSVWFAVWSRVCPFESKIKPKPLVLSPRNTNTITGRLDAAGIELALWLYSCSIWNLWEAHLRGADGLNRLIQYMVWFKMFRSWFPSRSWTRRLQHRWEGNYLTNTAVLMSLKF